MRILVALLLLLTLVGGSAAQDASPVIPTEWTCPDGFEGQTLSIFNWATYIGDNTVSDFELLCGVTVLYDVYDGDDAMLARLRQGNPGYDIAFPTDYAVDIMRLEGLLAEIDLANIPNIANIGEDFLDQSFDPGNQHSVPYVWGTTGIGYDIERVGYEIETWEDVFNCDCRVAWLDSPRAMFGIALYILGLDPNSEDADDVQAARDYLIEHASNVIVIASDDGDALLAQGEVDIAIEYGGDVYQQIVECDCDNLKYVTPEGAVFDLTSIVLLDGGPNPALAQVFMDYILDPVVEASIINTILYPSPNLAAIESGLIDEEFMSTPAANPSPEMLATFFALENVTSDAELMYNDAWDEVKIFSGL